MGMTFGDKVLHDLLKEMLDRGATFSVYRIEGGEFMAHLEWTPDLARDTSNGNASGFGGTPEDAIRDMVEKMTPPEPQPAPVEPRSHASQRRS